MEKVWGFIIIFIVYLDKIYIIFIYGERKIFSKFGERVLIPSPDLWGKLSLVLSVTYWFILLAVNCLEHDARELAGS